MSPLNEVENATREERNMAFEICVYLMCKRLRHAGPDVIQTLRADALQLDPAFALTYCGLADTYSFMGVLGAPLSFKEAWRRLREAALKALALDPNLAEAHCSLSFPQQIAFEFKASEASIKRALEINPNLTAAHNQYGWLLMMEKRYDESLAAMRKCSELEPLSAWKCNDVGWVYYTSRRYDEAIVQARQALALNANYANAHFLWGCALWQRGDAAGALAEFQKGKAADPQPAKSR